jgi:alpha-L-rhamnosidase
MVDKGATTIWELWNSDTEGPGMNSRNHFALGSVGEWYYEALAGLSTDPRAPGFKRLLVRPAPCADVTWADAGFRSMYGPVRSAWKIAKGDFVLKLTVPANTTAEVSIPMGQGTRVLEGGIPIEKSPGVKLIGLTRIPFGAAGGATRPVAVCEVGSGTYEFTVPGYASGTSP